MDTARFFGLAVLLFCAVFFGTKSLLTVKPLQPDARIPTFHRVDPNSPEMQYEQSSASDNDPTRDHLRNEVLDYAKALYDDPCNEVLKANYIKATVAYVRARISIASCVGTLTCSNADTAQLDRARQAFGTPLDNRVRDAMQKVHTKAVFGMGDFPKDSVRLIAEMASDGSINPAADPQFRRVSAQFGDSSSKQDCGH